MSEEKNNETQKPAFFGGAVRGSKKFAYTEEDLKAAYTFAFAEGIILGMNTNYKSKEFMDWLKERDENRLV